MTIEYKPQTKYVRKISELGMGVVCFEFHSNIFVLVSLSSVILIKGIIIINVKEVDIVCFKIEISSYIFVLVKRK